jgi:hypothetical protein
MALVINTSWLPCWRTDGHGWLTHYCLTSSQQFFSYIQDEVDDIYSYSLKRGKGWVNWINDFQQPMNKYGEICMEEEVSLLLFAGSVVLAKHVTHYRPRASFRIISWQPSYPSIGDALSSSICLSPGNLLQYTDNCYGNRWVITHFLSYWWLW